MINELKLDLISLQSVEEFHDRAAATLDFPAYYGRNKDAFWDCITDFAEPTTVRVCNFYSLTDTLRQALSPYIEMLRTYEIESKGKFSVVINSEPSPDSQPQGPRG
jgi:ribonuclease inhibitor